jgi:hypothetical protein
MTPEEIRERAQKIAEDVMLDGGGGEIDLVEKGLKQALDVENDKWEDRFAQLCGDLLTSSTLSRAHRLVEKRIEEWGITAKSSKEQGDEHQPACPHCADTGCKLCEPEQVECPECEGRCWSRYGVAHKVEACHTCNGDGKVWRRKASIPRKDMIGNSKLCEKCMKLGDRCICPTTTKKCSGAVHIAPDGKTKCLSCGEENLPASDKGGKK